MSINLNLTAKQWLFVKNTDVDEILYGGAAGGGKSFGQLADALIYALKYPRSRQLILRRTFPELEKSLIRVSLELYPKEVGRYNASAHSWKFRNGSVIDFGYCDSERDVYKYQSAEYDVIRFDELTHFTEYMYLYLMSRLRGVTPYPRSMKSSTNPGGIGHYWVKERFIDIGMPLEVHETGNEEGMLSEERTKRLFIPSLVTENPFLMKNDPDYMKRLRALPEKDRLQLLYGNWDTSDGQYFTEFNRDIHVIAPFEIPKHWRRYFSLDYGLDMCAGLWTAVDEAGNAFVYREFYQHDLIASEAAKRLLSWQEGDEVFDYIAPPDLWARKSDTGRSIAQIMQETGLPLRKGQNSRVQGWLNVKEYLKPRLDEFGEMKPKLKIFANCRNLIRSLPALQISQKDPNDAETEPHEITHAPDALRYFCAERALWGVNPIETDFDEITEEMQMENFMRFGMEGFY